MARPSRTWYGFVRSSRRSLNAAGSPSAPLHTANRGPAPTVRTDRHFSPVGKPAPPRPRSPLRATSSMTASGHAPRALSKPRPPPDATYSSNDPGAESSNGTAQPTVSPAPRLPALRRLQGEMRRVGPLRGGPSRPRPGQLHQPQRDVHDPLDGPEDHQGNHDQDGGRKQERQGQHRDQQHPGRLHPPAVPAIRLHQGTPSNSRPHDPPPQERNPQLAHG